MIGLIIIDEGVIVGSEWVALSNWVKRFSNYKHGLIKLDFNANKSVGLKKRINLRCI